MTALVGASASLMADTLMPSSTWPNEGRPEHVYTIKNGNNLISNSLTAPTQTEANFGLFAFYPVSGKDNAYYIYSQKAEQWLTYTPAASYGNGPDFVKMSDTRNEQAYFLVTSCSTDNYEIRPFTTSGGNDKYINWHGGLDTNPYDSNHTLGLWQQSGTDDPGSRYVFTEVVVVERTYTIVLPDEISSIKIGEQTLENGDTYTIVGSVKRSDITVVAPNGKFAAVAIDDVECTITVYLANLPTQSESAVYQNAFVYPAQQTAVGDAAIVKENDVYTLSNNVFSASFMKVGKSIYFAGSKAMNLEAGTELFTVGFGSGDVVPASSMKLNDVTIVDLEADPSAIGGVEHFAGKALVANYEYAYKDSLINIEWRAVLRDGSHYLRTEMELKGVDNIDMYDVIPMIYNVDTKAAGSTPAVIGDTRGAIIMNNKIFAGLETPTAYNTVGGGTGEEDKYDVTSTIAEVAVAPTAWTQVAEDKVPYRITEVTGAGYPDIFAYEISNIELKANQKVEVTVQYTGGSNLGNNRLNFGGADLLAQDGAISAMDYHSGYSGNQHDKNTFSLIAPNDGTYTVRIMAQDKSEPITANSKVFGKIYTPKEGVVINTDIVGIQGRWSRNTTLAAGETWKVAAVVGLIAQDGTEADENIYNTQKRRSFLAYSERERAVPWRANPVYISWYELNINRNNAAPGQEHTNFTAEQIEDVLRHWKSDMYDRYGVAANMFVIDDGWDEYGEWRFHSGFPNELVDMAALAKQMNNAGIGAWLGPVGGYGQSGNYRRAYWNDKGGMVLSNPAYYAAFKAAATNLVMNQGDNYTFFKFDGISDLFSAKGPKDGDQGNEDAEGIIRLERFVREELREDIFFNTTVGTWASPFWYQITDATWRQENDHDRIGNNNSNREKWITYRDRLVYQNYVVNSPICPINTIMTHGFMLSVHGGPSQDGFDHAGVLRELRCAFVCGSGMVELYNDYALMNSIERGSLWADLAECIAWQKRNADVLPDAHWVGGNPWTGSASQVYGWASWNGKKSTLALRNGANDAQTYNFTLRQALNIPKNVNGSIILRKSFAVQDALEGLEEGTAINIDTPLSVTLPGSSVFAFDGIDASATIVPVSTISLVAENGQESVPVNKTLVLRAVVSADATYPVVEWSSSNDEVATVYNGLVKPLKVGSVTITASATDGSGKSTSVTINVTEKEVEPYSTNFDKNANPSQTHRKINTITFTESGKQPQTVTVGQAKPYFDKTEECILTCNEGSELKVDWSVSGNWVNGYVYIDVDQDQQFSYIEGQHDQTGTDVMSYSFYTGSFEDDTNNGKNSAGKSLTGNNRNTMECPSFIAPAAGTYRIRFKMDWNSVDPGGQIGADGTCNGHNGFLANSGSIVDATLIVEGSTSSITEIESASKSKNTIYDLQGRKVVSPSKGIYIVNGKKVIF